MLVCLRLDLNGGKIQKYELSMCRMTSLQGSSLFFSSSFFPISFSVDQEASGPDLT